MYDVSPTLELEDLEELEDLGEFEDWELEDLEELEDLGESEDWEFEALRRRRRPVRTPRRRIRRPAARRMPMRAARRRIRRPVARRMPMPVARRRIRAPYRRPMPIRGVGRYIPVRHRRRRPVRVVRPYIPAPYTRYRPIQLPPVVIRVRPAAVLSRFSFERASLRRHHIPQIRRIARRVVASWRTGRPIRTIRLVGHTDNRGSARYNRRLGRQRALAVRSRLIRGINRLWPGLTRRISIIPQTIGEAKPIASNRTASGRALNRRVAIFLSQV
jgi:outer membrane protein OmpA-like peptidoglycan-associated protein